MGRFLRRKRVAGAPSEDGVWQVPARFNFTRDVVEAFAAVSSTSALNVIVTVFPPPAGFTMVPMLNDMFAPATVRLVASFT